MIQLVGNEKGYQFSFFTRRRYYDKKEALIHEEKPFFVCGSVNYGERTDHPL